MATKPPAISFFKKMLKGKHILLGITGSIAAYKAAMLCRLLRVAGAEVKVVMTPTAKEFITPVTMATLSKNPIAVEFYNPENGDWHSHIAMGEWADCYLIAPATANTLAKMAYGIADNLLLTTYLSARCQTVVAPAMDCDMFGHIATQENLAKLRERGVVILESPEGELASGLTGKGRMMEPEQIVEAIDRLLSMEQTLAGKRVMVTAGATIEAIDPVRYISNHSTGNDNVQAFFQHPAPGVDTVYSCRKFFGVPDGGYVSTDAVLAEEFEKDVSKDRMTHILGRFEGTASEFYSCFQNNDHSFEGIPTRHMSELTHNLLRGIDYDYARTKRNENYAVLARALGEANKLRLITPDGPFCYPFYCKDGMRIKKELAAKKIYVPTLWPNVLDLEDSLEKDFAENILPLPCDQRYDAEDMEMIIKQLR